MGKDTKEMTLVLVLIAGFFLIPIILPQAWKIFVKAVKFWAFVAFVIFTILYYAGFLDNVLSDQAPKTPEQAEILRRSRVN